MGIVIGIDVGGSTTKIVGVEDKKIKNPMFVKATDPVTSLFGAFGKYIYDNNISLSNIEKVILTGVGSAYIDQPLYGLPTAKTDEFLANGLGAQYNTGLDSLLVVSMGTGTSFVKVQGSTVEHIGGLGIGGGTILGLSKLLLKTHDFHQIASLAEHGSLNDIDLHIRDITPHPLPGLPLDVTASIFGKADANAKVEDIALGIVHMVLQTIGQGAVFASLNGDIKNIVLIGNLTRLPQCPDIFPVWRRCAMSISRYRSMPSIARLSGRLYAISGTGNIRIFFVESVRLHQNFMYLCYMLCSLSAIAG